ncbi:MAG: thrombospondin type 3 repeat-containing protein, partial [Phycisphaerae bacterium]|nr:thrombospondin type 3 repeat-containing protein [Phycisphaerae bacterium]
MYYGNSGVGFASDFDGVFSNIAPLENGGSASWSSAPSSGTIGDVFDYDLSTGIHMAMDANTWVKRDLGAQYYIFKVRAVVQFYPPSTGYLQVSNDDSSWTTVGSWSCDSYRGTFTPYYDVNGNWRYVRIHKSGCQWHHYCDCDIRVRQYASPEPGASVGAEETPAWDSDADGVPNYTDNCPETWNPDQADADGDNIGDLCDICPNDPGDDADGDGLCGDVDNCPNHPNPDQDDCDNDGTGDVCTIATGLSFDCNGNDIPDNCDISQGTSQDVDPVSGIPDECEGCPRPWTYTYDADFEQGTLLNLNYDEGDQLQLNLETEPFPYVWVAASGRGTIVRIDTETGEICGEYWSAPDGRGRNPSRTTVGLHGNVWAGNRDEADGGKGSVVSVGLVIGGTRVNSDGNPNPSGDYLAAPFEYCTCVDRNGDGLIKTSRGLTNIRSWSNSGGADNNGGVSTADDECIIKYVRVGGDGVRHVSVDANNNIWTGGHSDRHFDLLDGTTGAVLASFNVGMGGYGGLVDGNGVLWASSRNPMGLLRYDTKGTISTADDTYQNMSLPDAYGMGIDTLGNVWHTRYGRNEVCKYYPNGSVYSGFPKCTGGASGDRGVAVTPLDNNVWVANSHGSDVSRLDNNGTVRKVIGVGSMPTGVAVDANGKVWVTNYNSSNVMRIDPNAGGDGLGAVDLTVSLGSGASPYNYSDMTGIGLLSVVQQGSWTFVHEGRPAHTDWAWVRWNDEDCAAPHEPPSTSIVVEVRAAGAEGSLGGETYVQVDNGALLSGIVGTFLQLRVTLNGAPEGAASPVLCDLSIGGDLPAGVDCQSNGVPDNCDIVAGTSPDCNLNAYPDECEVASGAAADCNENGIPDECDIADATSKDCNANDVPDECEVAGGTAADCN